jgi:natural product precursor
MKTKKFNKKLALNKQTISNINNDEMNVLRGGDSIDTLCPVKTCPPTRTCQTWCTICITNEPYSCPLQTICA